MEQRYAPLARADAAVLVSRETPPPPGAPPTAAPDEVAQRRQMLAKVPLLQHLSDEQRDAVCKNLGSVEIPAEQAIVTVGEVGNSMFFVVGGSARAEVDGGVVNVLDVDDFFGEMGNH